jgi:EAL domain-containing protein (putative c-di-GMP-specific phosphodiesterase class I)
VSVGIDDFGTGYASMSYLKALPIDFVKIDQSFVAGVTTSREDHAIVRATLELARSLNLTTIAEGIETPEQLEVLRELGCDVAQGFLIGHPADSAKMLERFTS